MSNIQLTHEQIEVVMDMGSGVLPISTTGKGHESLAMVYTQPSARQPVMSALPAAIADMRALEQHGLVEAGMVEQGRTVWKLTVSGWAYVRPLLESDETYLPHE